MLVFKLFLLLKEERNKIYKKKKLKKCKFKNMYMCINFLGLRNNCGFIYICVLNFILNFKWKIKVNGFGVIINVYLFI